MGKHIDEHTVLDFWFQELSQEQWFKKDTSVDAQIAERFGDTLRAAEQC